MILLLPALDVKKAGMPKLTPWDRRHFLTSTATSAAAALAFPHIRAAEPEVLGQGGFRYRVVPGWGVLDEKTPVKNCHGIVQDSAGRIILLTDHAANHILIYDRAGHLLHKWDTGLPGAHGLSIVTEGTRQVLFLTCLQTHRVLKATLEGETLQEWRWPEHTGKYAKETEYKPSWTLHLPDGGFFILDGYGRDYITRYDAQGQFVDLFGGAEGGIAHWGPHGGMVDVSPSGQPSLLIAMSDQKHLLRLDLAGEKLAQVDLPGGNPRQIRRTGSEYFVAHLADNWPADRQSRGFISVLDAEMRVVSNIGGSAPEYEDATGALRPMRNTSPAFLHPHDLVVDDEGSLYVAQFASGNTYPVKLERV